MTRLPPCTWLGSVALCCALVPASALAQASFPVSFHASADALSNDEKAALVSHTQAAGRRWLQFLGVDAPRSIEVEIGIAAIPTANGASVTSSFVGVFGGRNTYEQGAAYEVRTGLDPNGADPDVRFNFGLDYVRDELWFDPQPDARSAPMPGNRTDAMSVLLHEFGHALAYNGWADGQGLPPADYWSTFDRWMQPGAPTLFDGPLAVQVWGSQPDVTTNNVHHWGNSLLRAARPTLNRAPVQWQDGVPLPQATCEGLVSMDPPPAQRLASPEGTPPPGLLAQLMNGVVFFRGRRYDLSALDLATLEDAGLPSQTASIFVSGFETP